MKCGRGDSRGAAPDGLAGSRPGAHLSIDRSAPILARFVEHALNSGRWSRVLSSVFLTLPLVAVIAVSPTRPPPPSEVHVQPSVSAVEPVEDPVVALEEVYPPAADDAAAPALQEDDAETSLADADDDDTTEDGDGADADAEAESHEETTPGSGHRYTADLSDEELERLWTTDPAALGSMSVGFADAGRLINGVPCREGENWTIVSPYHCWATEETLEFLYTALDEVARQHPGTRPIRVNHLSSRDGGWLRPHFSHQSGRDVDLGFYYKEGIERGWGRKREGQIDLARNWALVKTLVTKTDLQVILIDKRLIKALHAYALEQGEPPAWLDTIFASGRKSLVRHARGHYDHFHVRFYNARAQELGRRIVPLLARQPEQNFAMHRVRSGNTLGHIAAKYGSTVRGIKQANGMKSSFLRVGRVLKVPLRKPCTKCPLPPEVVVPERCLPPAEVAHSAPAPDQTLTGPQEEQPATAHD